MSSLFLCDNFGVLSRRFNTTCLGALYMSLFSEAEKICKFKVVPAEEQVYQIHKGEFIVYSPTPVTVNIRCRNGSVAEKHLKRGVSTIRSFARLHRRIVPTQDRGRLLFRPRQRYSTRRVGLGTDQLHGRQGSGTLVCAGKIEPCQDSRPRFVRAEIYRVP